MSEGAVVVVANVDDAQPVLFTNGDFGKAG